PAGTGDANAGPGEEERPSRIPPEGRAEGAHGPARGRPPRYAGRQGRTRATVRFPGAVRPWGADPARTGRGLEAEGRGRLGGVRPEPLCAGPEPAGPAEIRPGREGPPRLPGHL